MHTSSQSSWLPPPNNVIELNFDGAVDTHRNHGVIAVIARDSANILFWFCKAFPRVVDPLVLESLTCRQALCLAVDRGLNSIIIEADSLQVIQAIKLKPSFSYFGHYQRY